MDSSDSSLPFTLSPSLSLNHVDIVSKQYDLPSCDLNNLEKINLFQLVNRITQIFQEAKQNKQSEEQEDDNHNQNNKNNQTGNLKVSLDKASLDKLYHNMMSYDASLNEWKRFEYWNNEKRYTRNLVATDNENFTLMLLCWNKNKSSMAHAHSGSECFLRTIEGSVLEERFKLPDNQLNTLKAGDKINLELQFKKIHPPGQVCFINDNIGLHRISAGPSSSSSDSDLEFSSEGSSGGAVTLHLYIPPFRDAHCFDETGTHIVSDMTFDTENGNDQDFDQDF